MAPYRRLDTGLKLRSLGQVDGGWGDSGNGEALFNDRGLIGVYVGQAGKPIQSRRLI